MVNKNWGMLFSMRQYGGSFVKALAECFEKADPSNYQKLLDTFPEYVKEYSDLADTLEEDR